MGGKKKGRAVKKTLESGADQEPEELTKAPHTFVIYRGKLGKNCGELMTDFRKVMEPFTASKLKVQKRNAVKDFVAVAGLLQVSHMVVFTKTLEAMYMKVVRLPRGPTLTFKINNYSLARDVLSSLKRRVTYAKQFDNHPLLVLNNFSGEGLQLKLMTSMFQTMFPSININKVKLNAIRRCLLLNYDAETKTIEFRHYTIKVVPSGLSRQVKKIIQSKVPDLGKLEDISQFIENPGNASESEVEVDGPVNEVTLPQKIASRGNKVSQQSTIRLVELGPRMTLELVKIEEGIMDGEVIYHSLITKTPQEVKILKKKQQKRKLLKAQRRKQQEENLKRKQEDRKTTDKFQNPTEKAESDEEARENVAWFEKETGTKPDKELFVLKKRKHQEMRNVVHSKDTRSPKRQKTGKQESAKPKETGIQELLKRRKKRKETKKKKAAIAVKTATVKAHIKKMRQR